MSYEHRFLGFSNAGLARNDGLLVLDEIGEAHPKTISKTAFMQTLSSLDGQARRVAKRFALVAAALELAHNITGLAQGVGMAGIKQCFDDWFALNGTGKQEDRQIIENAVNFMQAYTFSSRFASWTSELTSTEHAGYRKTSQTELDEFWIVPKVFEEEILQGKDVLKGCLVLHGIGWLKKNGKRWKMQRFQNGRFYVLSNATPPEMPENLE